MFGKMPSRREGATHLAHDFLVDLAASLGEAMGMLTTLQLWMDPTPRTGPESMAVDEWLLETADLPVLRVYRWQGEWGTVGYFGELDLAKQSFPGLQWVRRWTGGGTVDHRNDWPYSVIVPRGPQGERMDANESYRIIHSAVAKALAFESMGVRLSCGDESTGAAACFANPVCHDVVDAEGIKLAGAGQRRSRKGFLHQGSVAVPCDEPTSRRRAERLASALSPSWTEVELDPPTDWIEAAVVRRYTTDEWMQMR